MTIPAKIIDPHIHLYDYQANTHTFLDEVDMNFMEIVGDYSVQPKKYLLENYLNEVRPYPVQGIVWHEYMSTDPIKEAKWGQALLNQYTIRHAMVTRVDFLDPQLIEKLEIYSSLPSVTGVREHMLWDYNNPKKRFASRADLLTDPVWQKQLSLLNKFNFTCALEIFTDQLPDVAKVIQHNPDIRFIIPALGWPSDLSSSGFQRWKNYLQQIAACENAFLEIHAFECVFGMNWTTAQVKPWVLSAIELFGADRCFFASHMPIAKLSRSFADLYKAYAEIIAGSSTIEQENLFYQVAVNLFRI